MGQPASLPRAECRLGRMGAGNECSALDRTPRPHDAGHAGTSSERMTADNSCTTNVDFSGAADARASALPLQQLLVALVGAAAVAMVAEDLPSWAWGGHPRPYPFGCLCEGTGPVQIVFPVYNALILLHQSVVRVFFTESTAAQHRFTTYFLSSSADKFRVKRKPNYHTTINRT